MAIQGCPRSFNMYTLEDSRLAKTRTLIATKLDQDKIGKMLRSQSSLVW